MKSPDIQEDPAVSGSSVPRRLPSRRDLFIAFAQIGVSGFGGVLPWARRKLVDDRQWITDQDFVEMLSLGQMLPGPNIVNVAMMVGRRFQGGMGALCCASGLLLLPFVIVLCLATALKQVEHYRVVAGAVDGVAAAAAGVMVAMGIKLCLPLLRSPWRIGICIVTFGAIAVVRWPLLWVIAVLGPIAIAWAWKKES